MALTHYIIVRRDLPLGVLAAMVTHAAGESASHFPDFRFEQDCRAVVLEAKNETALDKMVIRLFELGVSHVRIRESHGTYAGQLMAVGVVPAEKLEWIMKDYQLLKTCLPPNDEVFVGGATDQELLHQLWLDTSLSDDTCTCSNCREE